MLSLRTIADEVIDVEGSSIGFTASLLTGNVEAAVCRVGVANIRVNTVQGTDANATNDMPKWPGDEFVVVGMPDMANFRAIREGSTSAKLYVTYMGRQA